MKFVEVRDLTVNATNTTLLQNVSLTIEAGKAYALIGPNGAGKSTLLKAICGLRARDRGEVFIGNQPLESLTRLACSRWITYLPQNSPLAFPISVLDSILLGRVASSNIFGEVEKAQRDEASELLESWRMGSFAKRDLRSLSDGEKQKVSLIRGVYQGSKVMLLDETLSSLDVDQQLEAVERLRGLLSGGRTVVLVTHDINLATECGDQFLIIHKGKIVANGGEEVFANLELIRQLYPMARLEKIQGISGRLKFIFHRETRDQ